MTGYYDVVLGLIPLSLVGVSGVLVGAGVDLTTAVPIAGLLAVALIGHAMFVRGPGGGQPPGTSGPQSPGYGTAD